MTIVQLHGNVIVVHNHTPDELDNVLFMGFSRHIAEIRGVKGMNARYGRLFYDVTGIKEDNARAKSVSQEGISRAESTSGISKTIVRDSDDDVNREFSQRSIDQMTDRKFLARGFSVMAKNETEREFLNRYKEKIADLNDIPAFLMNMPYMFQLLFGRYCIFPKI